MENCLELTSHKFATAKTAREQLEHLKSLKKCRICVKNSFLLTENQSQSALFTFCHPQQDDARKVFTSVKHRTLTPEKGQIFRAFASLLTL